MILTRPGLALIQRLVCAFADAAGKAGEDEEEFPDRLNDLAQCVMHYPIPERRGAHQTPLGLVHVKVVVGAGPVGLVGAALPAG